MEEREKNKIQNNRYKDIVGNKEENNDIVKSQEIHFGKEELENNNNVNEVKFAQSQIIGNNNTYNKVNNNNNVNDNTNYVNSDGDKLTIEELKKMPYYENNIEFDKEKYKKPEVYKNIKHDKALIDVHPNKKAIEDYYNARQIPTKAPQRQMPSSLEDRNYIKVHYNPFEHQLDKFMKKNN